MEYLERNVMAKRFRPFLNANRPFPVKKFFPCDKLPSAILRNEITFHAVPCVYASEVHHCYFSFLREPFTIVSGTYRRVHVPWLSPLTVIVLYTLIVCLSIREIHKHCVYKLCILYTCFVCFPCDIISLPIGNKECEIYDTI